MLCVFDRVELNTTEVQQQEIEAAEAIVSAELEAAINTAAKNLPVFTVNNFILLSDWNNARRAMLAQKR